MGARHKFFGPVGVVACADVHVHYEAEQRPPNNAAMALRCWQCERFTWRYTSRCVHCGVGKTGRIARWLTRVLSGK